ncbi:hypothetical protein B0T18DRAFT_408560 [Schizothecium vesticola]|uniref:Uncharacterized protein n=1 Tax=Schizothecium vesticola TaxID=314040 RepID=A0AA40K9D3_9PEZI|nr:hypothetical protein B0T18DRAFT_408560 [Schizothecium vesticola]
MDSGSLLSGDIPLAFYHLASYYLSLSWVGRLGRLGRMCQKTEDGDGDWEDLVLIVLVFAAFTFFSTFLGPVPPTISGLL